VIVIVITNSFVFAKISVCFHSVCVGANAGTKKMEYKSRQWHEKCFSCFVCKTPIGTKSFIPREQDIYCSGCYEEKFATRCVKCTKVISLFQVNGFDI
jgi:hypothetical protein